MNKFLIIKNFIIASKKSSDAVVSENLKLQTQLSEKENEIIKLKESIKKSEEIIESSKIKYGATGAILGFGVGKL